MDVHTPQNTENNMCTLLKRPKNKCAHSSKGQKLSVHTPEKSEKYLCTLAMSTLCAHCAH
jgi:hypothetical protein